MTNLDYLDDLVDVKMCRLMQKYGYYPYVMKIDQNETCITFALPEKSKYKVDVKISGLEELQLKSRAFLLDLLIEARCKEAVVILSQLHG